MFCLQTFFLALSIKNSCTGKLKIKIRILDANTIMRTIQLNTRNMQHFSIPKTWQNIKVTVLFLLISVLKLLTILLCTYFKDLLKSSRKNSTYANRIKLKSTFFRKVNKVVLDASGFFEDDIYNSWCVFSDDEWDSIESESCRIDGGCERKSRRCIRRWRLRKWYLWSGFENNWFWLKMYSVRSCWWRKNYGCR